MNNEKSPKNIRVGSIVRVVGGLYNNQYAKVTAFLSSTSRDKNPTNWEIVVKLTFLENYVPVVPIWEYQDVEGEERVTDSSDGKPVSVFTFYGY